VATDAATTATDAATTATDAATTATTALGIRLFTDPHAGGD